MISRSLGQTEEVAQNFLVRLKPRKKAVVVGLRGDLGSGKTTFVQCVARALGVRGRVTSPTFVLQKIYPLKNQPFKKLIHLDCYRVEKPDEIAALSWQELLADPANLILVEWAERIAKILPKNHQRIRFRFVSETRREIKLDRQLKTC